MAFALFWHGIYKCLLFYHIPYFPFADILFKTVFFPYKCVFIGTGFQLGSIYKYLFLWQSKPDAASCGLNSSIRGPAVEQKHHQEPNLPNLMAKLVDKARRN